ncbi:MAG: DUF2914 domain-containing protein [Vicinamibacterales bacterium]
MRVTEAGVCTALSRGAVWTCTAIDGPVQDGVVYYYTRVASASDIEVRHRWTRDGHVAHVATLDVGANPSSGYRTFSRQTVARLGSGAWAVELLAPNGDVIDARQFSVP